jgi:hypothetical protein
MRMPVHMPVHMHHVRPASLSSWPTVGAPGPDLEPWWPAGSSSPGTPAAWARPWPGSALPKARARPDARGRGAAILEVALSCVMFLLIDYATRCVTESSIATSIHTNFRYGSARWTRHSDGLTVQSSYRRARDLTARQRGPRRRSRGERRTARAGQTDRLSDTAPIFRAS